MNHLANWTSNKPPHSLVQPLHFPSQIKHLSLCFPTSFMMWNAADLSRQSASRGMKNAQTHRQRIARGTSAHEGCKKKNILRDIHFLISFLISFHFDVNTLRGDWDRDKSLRLCAHAQCGHAQQILVCRAYRGVLPKHEDTLPTMLRGGLKLTRLPSPPSLPT